MQKIIDWFKFHWQQRIFKICTVIAVVVGFMEIFHKPELDIIITSPGFITAICAILVGIKA